MELKTTKEKVLEAASKCPAAKETLEILFPECFDKSVENIKNFSVSLVLNDNPYMYIGYTHVQDSSLWNKCFILKEVYFNWELKRQDNGALLLIPTKK